MKFKGSVVPNSVESKKCNGVKPFVECNIVNPKKGQSIAMYKLGMSAILIVMEFMLPIFCRLDIARFMKWHHANNPPVF